MQQIAKLEEQIAVMSQESKHKDEVHPLLSQSLLLLKCNPLENMSLFICSLFIIVLLHLMQLLSTERANRNREQLNLQENITVLQQRLESEQQAAEGIVQMSLLCFQIEGGTVLPKWSVSFQF